jgi:hypothetical protein
MDATDREDAIANSAENVWEITARRRDSQKDPSMAQTFMSKSSL